MSLAALSPRRAFSRRGPDADSILIRTGPADAQLLPAHEPRTRIWAYNGIVPGPLIRVPQNATITVNVTNHLDLPTAIHWHGIRLENRFDGVPGVTQDPVEG